MNSFKVRFIDSQSATISDAEMHFVPRVGEEIRFRAGAGGETTLTVKTVVHTLPDPKDPPAQKEPYDAVVVLALTAVGEVGDTHVAIRTSAPTVQQ